MKLTKKELGEPTLVTIGRLKTAIKYGSLDRQLTLLQKIADDLVKLETIKEIPQFQGTLEALDSLTIRSASNV